MGVLTRLEGQFRPSVDEGEKNRVGKSYCNFTAPFAPISTKKKKKNLFFLSLRSPVRDIPFHFIFVNIESETGVERGMIYRLIDEMIFFPLFFV